MQKYKEGECFPKFIKFWFDQFDINFGKVREQILGLRQQSMAL